MYITSKTEIYWTATMRMEGSRNHPSSIHSLIWNLSKRCSYILQAVENHETLTCANIYLLLFLWRRSRLCACEYMSHIHLIVSLKHPQTVSLVDAYADHYIVVRKLLYCIFNINWDLKSQQNMISIELRELPFYNVAFSRHKVPSKMF
jgi:hypothetical protein